MFGDAERSQFVAFLREYEAFCGVRVVTFCIMSNHFHILVEVPKHPQVLPSDEELLARVEGLSGKGGGPETRQKLEACREVGDELGAQAVRDRLAARMWNISNFIKELKQRFTTWFNEGHSRTGTLWQSRFKSTLVEGAGEALSTMAAYIDLNPVRAGMVNDPKDYPWSGYSEAMAGRQGSQEGLRRVSAGAKRVDVDKVSVIDGLSAYRMLLFGQGEQRCGVDAEAQPLRRGIPRAEVLKVILNKGRVPVGEFVMLRVRYFTDGMVLGSREFVEGVFQFFRGRFGKNRKTGARRVRGVQSNQLFTVRDLRVDVLG